MDPITIWTITIGLFAIGLAGTIIPALPGVGIIFAGILFFAIATNFASISITSVVVLGIASVLVFLANFLGSMVGARMGGGKKYAVIGTIVGALLGAVTGGPILLFIGAFLGALAGALAEGSTQKQALKVATVSLLGTLGGIVMQFLLATIVIITFALIVLF